MCGSVGASSRRTVRPLRIPSVFAPSSSLVSNRSWRPRQIPRNGRPAASQAADRLGQTMAVEACHRRFRGADAGHDQRVGARGVPRRRGRRVTSAPTVVERLVDADEVAGAVIDDGDAGTGASSPERALGGGDARPPGIRLAGDPQGATERLERGLGQMVVVATGAASDGALRPRSGRTPRGRARRVGAAGLRLDRRETEGR